MGPHIKNHFEVGPNATAKVVLSKCLSSTYKSLLKFGNVYFHVEEAPKGEALGSGPGLGFENGTHQYLTEIVGEGTCGEKLKMCKLWFQGGTHWQMFI